MTLRELLHMHRGYVSQQWDHTAAVICSLANIHRDSKKRRKAYEPSEFHPFAKRAKIRRSGTPITKDSISLLKVFC